MQQTLGTTTVDVNDEGFLTNPDQWTPDIARDIARAHGITLTDQHFEVLQYLRDRYAEGTPLTIRRLGKSGLVTIKEFYDLFPGGPLKMSSKIAGIPKPTSCV